MVERAEVNLVNQKFSSQCCFEHDQFSAYFLTPKQFREVAVWVGAVRAESYRQVSPHGPLSVDLDGRDDHYWHLLILDQKQGDLAGSLRMALSTWHGPEWDGGCSYLEHCYPGLDQAFHQGHQAYAEIGRTFVAAPYRRSSPVLLMLLRAMASIPLATGHSQLLGMVSYNHFQHREVVQRRFLTALLQPPFAANLGVPPPRYPLPFLLGGEDRLPVEPRLRTLRELEINLGREENEKFRVPLLLKKYMSFGNARVVGMSFARDFNQICEILMHCDLAQLPPRKRRIFLLEDLVPVWEISSSS